MEVAAILADHLGCWKLVGSHEVRIDEDIVWFRNHGEINLADQKQFYALCYAMYLQWGYILSLNDVRDLSTITPEARRALNDEMRQQIYPSYTAIYGANPAIRTIAALGQRGIRLLTGKIFPIGFAKDEKEARTLLAQQRILLTAARGVK